MRREQGKSIRLHSITIFASSITHAVGSGPGGPTFDGFTSGAPDISKQAKSDWLSDDG